MVLDVLKGALVVLAVTFAAAGIFGIVAMSREQNDVMSDGERLLAGAGALFVAALAANALL